ncbi:MAG: PqqD family protein [Candidatus Omnitrophica bacterium]|nr:PqqD family protein [Candidatus Omnitrophota bacterium]
MVFTAHTKIREEKFGAVIFETLKEKIFITNRTGKDILNLLQKGSTLEEIVDTLVNSYSAPITNIRNDVTNFINQLKDNSILTR